MYSSMKEELGNFSMLKFVKFRKWQQKRYHKILRIWKYYSSLQSPLQNNLQKMISNNNF